MIVGIGEVGGVLARGILKCGFPVYPVTRNMSLKDEVKKIPDPQAVILAVSENDFQSAMDDMPEQWKDRLVLLQNELLPRDWTNEGVKDPTVLVVWFEKKPGQDFKVLLPSPVYGKHSELIMKSLEALGISSQKLSSDKELLYELVRKNVYILTTNIAGLITGGVVRDLMERHHDFSRKVASDVMDIQDYLTQTKNDRTALLKGLDEAYESDPDHKCMGRSAPGRLARQLHHARDASLPVSVLQKIAVEKL